ncbi:hypothetical protein [uncultured Kordia sp.]|uniref:hypothetical protein n=1 Tax=uncultured Kordia sp. TaxID=507699 RepID=UPI0026177DD3|nr:hypothetical protein [uncultured Kordia sp.]
MIELSKKVTFLVLVLVGLSSCNEYVEYKPHYLSNNNEHKYYGKPELDSAEFHNTIQVLVYYEETFKTKNSNVILITKQLSNDWELLWNYTTKAQDEDWLKTHKKE